MNVIPFVHASSEMVFFFFHLRWCAGAIANARFHLVTETGLIIISKISEYLNV